MIEILDTVAYVFCGVVFLYVVLVLASCFWWQK